MSRYLTEHHKQIELARWKDLQMNSIRPADNPGGHGYVDPEIVHWCDKLNEIEGVCTLQSCCGHILTSALDGQNYIDSGKFWIWLSESKAREFYRTAMKLAESPNIERLCLLFMDWGQELVEIHFRGLERGTLKESMSDILGFFRGLEGE